MGKQNSSKLKPGFSGTSKVTLPLAYIAMVLLLIGMLFYFIQLMMHARSQATGHLSNQARISSEKIEREVFSLEALTGTLATFYFEKTIQVDETTAYNQLLENLKLHMASGHFKIKTACILTTRGHLTTLHYEGNGEFRLESEMLSPDQTMIALDSKWEVNSIQTTLWQRLKGMSRQPGVLKLQFATSDLMAGFQDNPSSREKGKIWWLDQNGVPAPGTFDQSSTAIDEIMQTLLGMMGQLENGVIETTCPFHLNHKAFTAIAPVFVGDYDLAIMHSMDASKVTGPQIRLTLILSALFACLLALAIFVLKQTINQRKSALHKLADEKAVIEGMFHSIDDLIFQQDLKGNYKDCNQSFANFFGLKPVQIRDRNDEQIGIPQEQILITENDRNILRKARKLASEVWMEGPGGQQELIEIHKHPLQHMDGKVYGVIGI